MNLIQRLVMALLTALLFLIFIQGPLESSYLRVFRRKQADQPRHNNYNSTKKTNDSITGGPLTVPKVYGGIGNFIVANTTIIMYSLARKDRAGNFIQDMICAHIYALRHNYTYAGACNVKPTRRPERLYQRDALALLRFTGLDDPLPFHGPATVCPAEVWNTTFPHNTILVSRGHYDPPDKSCFRHLDWWRSVVLPFLMKSPAFQTKSPRKGAVVHIRRGDVTPCSSMSWVRERYLSNRFYANVMRNYIPFYMNVTIYSEKASLEPWETLLHNNNTTHLVTFRLDSPLHEVWHHILRADVLVVSKSLFSYVPAVLNLNAQRIVYPTWKYTEPLNNWTVISDQLVQQAHDDVQQLQQQFCPDKALMPSP
jgi:hypothetical protein